jgi:hypothetical protein
MSGEATNETTALRRLRVLLAWVVGVGGVIATLVSIAPSLFVAFSYLSALTGAVLALVLAEVSVPVFVALAIGNARQRWWLWLVLAIIAIVVVLAFSPAFGSLGVFWLRF